MQPKILSQGYMYGAHKHHEKNIAAASAAVEEMMAGAPEDVKPGLQPKPTKKNITTATVETMRAGALEDFSQTYSLSLMRRISQQQQQQSRR